MALLISWSSVSNASVKTMHLQQSQLNDHPVGSSHVQQTDHVTPSQHCLDQALPNIELKHSENLKNTQMQHLQCLDCSLFSCQSSIIGLEVNIPTLNPVTDQKNLNSILSAYQVYYPLGYLQKILRPPKA